MCILGLAQVIGVSASTGKKICRDDLSLFPYKMQLNQTFPNDEIARSWRFCEDVWSAIWISEYHMISETEAIYRISNQVF
jgi:hypothetical protein